MESGFSSPPIAKHKCYDLTLQLHNCESEDGGSDDGSSPESANDSNSFMIEDTDSAMSPLYGSNLYQSGDYKSHSSGKVEGNVDLPPDGPINIRQILEEELLELGNVECGHDWMEQCADNESDVDNNSSGGNQKRYVLSSGRWNIEQGIVWFFSCYMFFL